MLCNSNKIDSCLASQIHDFFSRDSEDSSQRFEPVLIEVPTKVKLEIGSNLISLMPGRSQSTVAFYDERRKCADSHSFQLPYDICRISPWLTPFDCQCNARSVFLN